MSGIEALLSKPGTTTMAWALVHFLWQGAAVALLLGLVLAVVPRRLSQIRFAAAVMALGVMLILPLATGIILWPDTTPTIPSGPGPLMPLEVSDIQQSNPVNQAITQIGLTAKDRNMNAFLPMILGFWILGVSLFTARNLSSLIQVRNLSRRGTFAPPREMDCDPEAFGRAYRCVAESSSSWVHPGSGSHRDRVGTTGDPGPRQCLHWVAPRRTRGDSRP